MGMISLTVEQLSALSALGLTTEQIVRAAEIICPGTNADATTRRREKDRERKRLKRATANTDKADIADVSADKPADTLLTIESSPSSLRDSGKEKVEIQHPREDRFGEFWAAYPKREGTNPRKPAADKFARLVARGADPGEIISGAHRYAQHLKATGKDGSRFVQQAVTWLNQESWKDEYHKGQGARDNRDIMGAFDGLRTRFGAANRADAQGGGFSDGLFDRPDADLDLTADHIDH